MLKGKIISSIYVGGTSIVTKATKYGTFTGVAVLQEEDRDIESTLLGGYFAELKCDIQAYHRKAEDMRERARGIEHAFNVIVDATATANNDSDDIMLDDTLFRLWRQVSIGWKQARLAQEEYENMRDTYPDVVEITLRSKRSLREAKAQMKNNKR